MTDDRFKFSVLWVTIVGLCSYLIYNGTIGWSKFIVWIDALIGKL